MEFTFPTKKQVCDIIRSQGIIIKTDEYLVSFITYTQDMELIRKIVNQLIKRGITSKEAFSEHYYSTSSSFFSRWLDGKRHAGKKTIMFVKEYLLHPFKNKVSSQPKKKREMNPSSQIYIPIIHQPNNPNNVNYPTKAITNDILFNIGKDDVHHLSVGDTVTIFKKHWKGSIHLFCRTYHLNMFLFEDMIRKSSIYIQGYRAVKRWLLGEREEKFFASGHDPIIKRTRRPVGYEKELVGWKNTDHERPRSVGIHLLDPCLDPIVPRAPIGV